MKRELIACGLIVLVVSLASAKGIDVGYEPEGIDELTKQKGAFKTTMVHPEADFSRYESIQPREPVLFVLAPAPQAQTTGSLVGRGDDTVVPETSELASFKEILSTIVASQIESSTDLEVVESSGPATLVLRPIVSEAEFTTSSRYRNEEGEEVPILSRATVVFDLIDGDTGVIVARLGERRKAKRVKGVKGVVEDWPLTRAWTEAVAADLCQELQRLQRQMSKG